MLLHDDKELDDDLRGRPDHDLSLSPLLGVVHALQSIVQNADSHHFVSASFRSESKTQTNSESEIVMGNLSLIDSCIL